MYSMFPVSKRAHSQGETLDDIQANLREASEMLVENENPALNRPYIHSILRTVFKEGCELGKQRLRNKAQK